jgi:hypothetical protein
VTNKERECIRDAARRYVREQAPSPPIEVLERVARIVLQARTLTGQQHVPSNHPHPASTRGNMMQPAAEKVAKGAA